MISLMPEYSGKSQVYRAISLGFSHAGGMPGPVEANEVANPVAVGLLGARAVAFHPQGGSDLVHQLRRFAVRIHTPILSVHGCTYSIIGAGKTRKRANSDRWPRFPSGVMKSQG